MLSFFGFSLWFVNMAALLYAMAASAAITKSGQIPDRSRWLTIGLPVALFAANAALFGAVYQTEPFETRELLFGVGAIVGFATAGFVRLALTRRYRRLDI